MEARPREQPPSMMYQYAVMIAFTALGIYCSKVVFGPSFTPPTHPGSHDNHPISCDYVREVAKLPPHVRSYMGTKLRYQFGGVVKNETLHEDCIAEKVYGVVRHGTRYPSLKYIKKWQALSNKLQALTDMPTNALAIELREWVSPFNDHHAAHMTDHGLKEQYCLGKRFLQRFPQLHSEPYCEEYYSFSSSRTPRTVQSGLSFANGLFEGKGPLNGYQPIHLDTVDVDKDVLLRFDELPCPKYDSIVTSNQTLRDMLSGYLATDEIVGVVKRVQEMFSNDDLTVSDVQAMYKICLHEISFSGKSRWCELFSTEDLLMLNYYTDLRAYWVKGPGFSLTKQRSVHLLEDIVRFLQDDKGQKVIWRFGHAETLLPLLSLLGVANSNKDLLHNNYNEMLTRQFSTSDLTPFSANIAFVKYNCQSHDGTVYVRVLVNERPIRLKICDEQEMCELNQLVSLAGKLTNQWTALIDLCQI